MNTKFFKLKFKFKYKNKIFKGSKVIFWFLAGAVLSFVFVSTFVFFTYQKLYSNKVYPGVYINNTDFGGKSKSDVKNFFISKNSGIGNKKFILVSNYGIATISATQIDFGYDTNLLSDQAYSVGRSENFLSNVSLILQSNINGVYLSTTYSYNQSKLTNLIATIAEKIEKKPIDAILNFEDNRVKTFRPSENGQTIDEDLLYRRIIANSLTMLKSNTQNITVNIPIETVFPTVTTGQANDLGIKELIGEGHSLFYHSIPGRIFNVNLAATRMNGILIPPGEIFSFDKALGDVSAFTGYKQAYVIQNGKTVLGDGGGVCQVSTTFFRAVLNGGLPITERHAHAYRVGYYEQDSAPGIDATIFVPTVDLKFKNDTNHYILIQSKVDLNNYALSFYLYGTSDGREVSISRPVVSNQIPAPPDLYQDDPTLPKGEIKQTDFAANGAKVYFTRTVSKSGKTILSDRFDSNYRPWQAVYLRGTKE